MMKTVLNSRAEIQITPCRSELARDSCICWHDHMKNREQLLSALAPPHIRHTKLPTWLQIKNDAD